MYAVDVHTVAIVVAPLLTWITFHCKFQIIRQVKRVANRVDNGGQHEKGSQTGRPASKINGIQNYLWCLFVVCCSKRLNFLHQGILVSFEQNVVLGLLLLCTIIAILQGGISNRYNGKVTVSTPSSTKGNVHVQTNRGLRWAIRLGLVVVVVVGWANA